ncbi:MAG TPA: DUF3501 family protein [Anaeromyxobacteraceae bacterium]|nr:DUF3501 family protein [Anaeromyxobacteraceae bacterium]
MQKVQRSEILDLQTYDRERPRLRPAAMEAKEVRRIHLGPHLTFLFENRETIRYQIHEMVRAERLFREEEIAHELDTYNELLGGPGELGCSLLIEIADPRERDEKLRRWLRLLEHLYLRTPDGRKVRPSFDPRQVGEDRLSSVQYLKFDVGGTAPAAVGCDLPDLAAETELSPAQRQALADDLRS